MSVTDRFLEYAEAFEKAFRSDHWSAVAPFFTEGAVYETIAAPPFGALHEGREAILKSFKESVDTFDRRFDVREVKLVEGPEEREGVVWVSWRATFRVEGAPDLVLEGEERAWFDGDRIDRLEDRIAQRMAEQATVFLDTYGAKLHPAAQS